MAATLTETTRERFARLTRLARDPKEHRNLVRLLTYYQRLDARYRVLPELVPPAQNWGVLEGMFHIIGDFSQVMRIDNARRTAIAGWFRDYV